MLHLFTYGTLMFPEVWRVVVGKEFQTLPAVAPGYQIFHVRGAVYPGIIAIDASLTSDQSLPAAAGPLTSSSVSSSPPSALDPPLSGSRSSILAPRASSPVPGLLYLNVDAPSIERLDRFEDDFYRRQSITVITENGQELAAEAYIVPQESRHVLTDEIWTPEEFQARGDLARFVAKYAGFNRLS